MQDVPVYLFTGMLESGKTTFIRTVLDEFSPDTKTLLLVCEEGEADYDGVVPDNVVLAVVDDADELTSPLLDSLQAQHKPDQVLVELNGMWSIAEFGTKVPKNWVLFQSMCFIDASTFALYVQNMPEQIMEKIRHASMVVFNRCTPETAQQLYKRNLRIINRQATIYLEYADGTVEDYQQGQSDLFDMSLPLIEVPSEDFGPFYVELMEQTDKYVGKKVRFTGLLQKNKEFGAYFAVGRMVMTCCADDMGYCGFACQGARVDSYPNGSWLEITGVVKKAHWKFYEGEGPILSVVSVRTAQEPENAVVEF